MTILLSSLMLSAVLFPTQGTVQSPDKVVEELKGIRARLETLEKSQRMLVALARIQIDELRLAPLELQRRALAAQEIALTQEMGKLAPTVQRQAGRPLGVTTADGSDPALMPRDPGAAQVRYDEAARKLDETRVAIRALDDAIAPLKSQIAAWEKVFRELER